METLAKTLEQRLSLLRTGQLFGNELLETIQELNSMQRLGQKQRLIEKDICLQSLKETAETVSKEFYSNSANSKRQIICNIFQVNGKVTIKLRTSNVLQIIATTKQETEIVSEMITEAVTNEDGIETTTETEQITEKIIVPSKSISSVSYTEFYRSLGFDLTSQNGDRMFNKTVVKTLNPNKEEIILNALKDKLSSLTINETRIF